jgi:hypothetical protein
MEYKVAKDGMARGVSYPSKTELKIAKRKQLGLIRAPAGPTNQADQADQASFHPQLGLLTN